MINLNDKLQQREIRIFISSTFRDMMDERDRLVKQVFPKLRKQCQARGVELTEVDLRWGVTEEQAQEGKVIEICLREIDRCRPYFIGLLGERYGWVPGAQEVEKQRRILNEFPWVRADVDDSLSITEMEIQYGVLRNPEQVAQAFFYLRDPATTPAEFKEAEGSVTQQKLTTLKAAIRQQERHPHHDYQDLDELEAQIVTDFTDFLNKHFPEAEAPSHLERMRLDHAAFAVSRLKVYIGGQEYVARLDQHVDSQDPPLVVTGESGQGKSALLANWIAHYQRQHPETFVLYHFIGGAPNSTNSIDLMQRIMQEMQARFGIAEEIPANSQKIAEAFPSYLAKAPRAQKWVLVLDALNQLEDMDNARWLGWLPNNIPENIRLIVSTLPGESLDTLVQRQYPQLIVKPLDLEARKTLITHYLKFYTKELAPEFVERIAQDPESNNPLILRTILDELRIFGEHERLESCIDYYLKPATPRAFFDAVLQRLEQDYEQQRPGMVGEILALIWAARRGLSENEILAITGIPALYWTPLYNAIENHLVSRAGLLDISHDYLRQAIEARYLDGEDKKKTSYLQLADYFEQYTLSLRAIDELPYQLVLAKEWERLKDVITNIDVFMKLYDYNTDLGNAELSGYIVLIEKKYDLEEVFQRSLASYEDTHKKSLAMVALAYDSIGVFFEVHGKYEAAIRFLETALKLHKQERGVKDKYTVRTLQNLGLAYSSGGELNKAQAILEQALMLREATSSQSDIAITLSNLACVLDDKGEFERAEPLHRRALAIFEKSFGPEHPHTAAVLNNLAGLLREKGDFDQAELNYRRVCAIFEKIRGPDHPSTATSWNNLAALFYEKGELEQAEQLYRRALAIRESVLGLEHPDTIDNLTSLAALLSDQGRYEQSELIHRRVLEIRERCLGPDHSDTASSLNNLAFLLDNMGDYDQAEPLYRRALAIRENVQGLNDPRTATVVNNLAQLLYNKKAYDQAEPLYRRALSIREKTLGPEHKDTATSLNNLAALLYAKGDSIGAEPLIRRALAICEKVLGAEHPETIKYLANLKILRNENNSHELASNEENFQPEHPDSASSLIEQALSRYNQGDTAQAEHLFNRALAIQEKILGPVHPGTVNCLNNLARLYIDTGDYKKAELFYLRYIDSAKKLYGAESWQLASAMSNLSVSYRNQERYADAESLNEQALELYIKVFGAEHASTVNTATNLALLKFLMQKNDEAVALCQRYLDRHRVNEEKLETIVPGQLRKLAKCYYHLACQHDVPNKQWQEAKTHLRLAIDYFTQCEDYEGIEKAEQQLQEMFSIAGISND